MTGVLALAWFHDVEPVIFYLQNGAYHTKFALFIVMAVVWLYPAVKFFNWRRTLQAGGTRNRVLSSPRVRLTG